MKNKLKSVRRGSKSAAASQSKTHGADGAIAQTPEDLLNLVRSHATWSITSNATKGLHRTQDGQLILLDRTPADLSGYVQYANARPVSYADACKWIGTSGNRWKPEMLLQFHGIMPPDTRRRAGLVTVVFKNEAGLECARIRPAGTITCVWTLPDGSEFARVEFPRDLFARIDRCASKLGITLQQFFDNAIREACKRHGVFASLESGKAIDQPARRNGHRRAP